jgi:hypothetical protein
MAKLGLKRFTFSAEKTRKKYGKLGWKHFTFSAESIDFFSRVTPFGMTNKPAAISRLSYSKV